MATALDYLRWRGDLKIGGNHPFNSVDAALLASIIYLPFDETAVGHTLAEISEEIKHHTLLFRKVKDEAKTELDLLPLCDRLGSLKLLDWVDKFETNPVPIQFSAGTFRLTDHKIVVVYRGTDSSMVGWKEDFYMNYQHTITGQDIAATYLKEVAKKFPDDDIYVTGHSKGGNFALYASAYVTEDVQDRIIQVTNFDGPGFYYNVLNSDGYKRILPKMKTYIPEGSTFGIMLDHTERVLVVKSVYPRAAQHDPRRWSVGRNSFVLGKELQPASRIMRHALIEINDIIPAKARRQAYYTLFDTFEQANINDVNQISLSSLKGTLRLGRVYYALDPETRRVFNIMLAQIWQAYRKNLNLPFMESKYRNMPISNDSYKKQLFYEFYSKEFYEK
ncbi:MAG: DUF2974 domain-containing protein [Lactobacillus sp.]|nr:DUF2974 domain-containing protein [Lactobacillus sp.]